MDLKKFYALVISLLAAPIRGAAKVKIAMPGRKGAVPIIMWLVLIVVVGAVGYSAYGYFTAAEQQMKVETANMQREQYQLDETSVEPEKSLGYATTVMAGAINAITGATLDVNTRIYNSDGTLLDGETQCNSLGSSLSTAMPNTVNGGRMMIGNDHDQGTDRGTEIYYRRVPVDYTSRPVYTVPDSDGAEFIKLFPETTSLTVTGYDQNSAETTLNISVGAGARYTDVDLQIAIAASTQFGNDDKLATEVADSLKTGGKVSPNYPIGVCFNVSGTGTGSKPGDWEEIRPDKYVGTFNPCEVNKSLLFTGDCYVLDTGALADGKVGYDSSYTFGIIVDADGTNNPASSTAQIHAWFYDATYYIDDNGQWRYGFCDDSKKGTDYDPGFDASTATKIIYLE